MSIAEHLEGKELPGNRIEGTWTVEQKFELPNQHTYGCYSIGYKVRHENGREAFMKASDLQLLTEDSPTPFERLQVAVKTQEFERTILQHCEGNNMDRVVVALDYGDLLEVYDGVIEPLFYLIFELAECDARVQVNQQKRFNFTWCVTALHNLAVAIQQLHSGKVSHNDIKPSNLLVFDKSLQKLGDLGSATSPEIPAIHDKLICPGDPRYAAPEVIYEIGRDEDVNISFERRRACDLYLLGSMANFFVTGEMMTKAVLEKLNAAHRPQVDGEGWTGTFEAVLPYWREAFGEVLAALEAFLPQNDDESLTEEAKAFLVAVTQLCEPDPDLRGHPNNRRGTRDQFGLEQYISLFNRLRTATVTIH